MDILKFGNTVTPTKLEQGQIVNGIRRKMWVERYDQAGEFEFVTNLASGVREALPVGSLVSHVNTSEVMIVENHELSEDQGSEPELVITGRGFETYFENRIVGSNKTFYTTTGVVDYQLSAASTWAQIVSLLQDHILASHLIDDDTALPYVTILEDVNPLTVYGDAPVELRALKRKDLYSTMLEIMKVDSLGIKVVRPGVYSPLEPSDPNLAVVVHTGDDLTKEIIFSYDTGEIESADYLWSNKRLKNCAHVYGKWVEAFVDTDAVGYDRRMMLINATDIDTNIPDPGPTPEETADILSQMYQRGLEALAANKFVELTKAQVSKNVVKASYRKDFNLGDIITVNGDYSVSAKRRVSEYVEIEDENGSTAHPTLTTV